MDRQDFTPQERSVLALCGLGHFFTHLGTLLFPPLLLSISRDFGMGATELAGVAFAGRLLFGLLAPLAGWAADRWSVRWLLTACLALIGLGLGGAAAASGPFLLSLALAVVGVGASIYHPAGLALISRTVRAQGRAMGTNGVWGNLGIALAPLVAGGLVWLSGWRLAFALPAAAALVGALVTGFDPRLAGVGDAPQRPATGAPSGGAADGRSMTPLLVLLAGMILSGMLFDVVTLALPAVMETRMSGWLAGRSEAEITLVATALTSAVTLMGIPGQLWGGRLADRLPRERLYWRFQLVALVALAVLSLGSGAALVLGGVGYMMFGPGSQPIENSLVARLSPGPWRARAYGLKFIMSFGVGSLGTVLVRSQGSEALAGVFQRALPLSLGAVCVALLLARATSATAPAKAGI